MHYNINIDTETNTLSVGFGAPGDNSQIVRDADARLKEMIKAGMLGGKLLKISRPASMPVAFVLGHSVAHLYDAIAIFDPKLQSYVVAISHSPDYQVGDLISNG